MKTYKMKITKEQLYNIDRATRRQIDIETGFKGCKHKAHKMKTDYNRAENKRINFED